MWKTECATEDPQTLRAVGTKPTTFSGKAKKVAKCKRKTHECDSNKSEITIMGKAGPKTRGKKLRLGINHRWRSPVLKSHPEASKLRIAYLY